tara:strand:- start:1131 stop:2267 length:1137 start_codon:yes stop_codon:yes gene_type:complete
MSNFKIKKKKKNKLEFRDSTTLDKRHKEKSQEFKEEKELLPDKIVEIKDLEEKLEKINTEKSTFSDSDLELKANILNRIEILKAEINCTQNNELELDYYDKTGEIICNYYKLRDEKKNEFSESRNILDYFSKKKINEEPKKSSSRTNLFNEYCQRVDGTRTVKDDGSNRIKYCIECKIEKVLDAGESSYVCPICGDSEEIILDEDRQIKEYSPYKRINHFKEWINQFQAKETTEISENIFIEIIEEINKNRIKDLSTLDRDKMKQILKKLGYNNLYEHIPYIINKLSGLEPPTINRHIEMKFIDMFTKIQDPWEKFKPTGRKNFLSYSYVLHKFCQLLELDHLLTSFPLLKSIKNLKEQEQVWERICKYLKWEFISSI